MRRRLRDDVTAAFPVLEAVLVAILVLTAIIFFTSFQRPTSGAEQGGIDLAKVSGDTLEILKARTFPCSNTATVGYKCTDAGCVSACPQTLEGWVSNVTAGDVGASSTAVQVDTFLRQVLPAGTRYSLRLDNGVSSIQILPTGTPEQAFEGRASEIVFMPNWATFRNSTASAAMRVVTPGQLVTSGDALMGSSSKCFEAPFAGVLAPGGSDWTTYWQSTIQSTTPTTNGKDNTTILGSNQQIPKGLPLGKWRVSTTTAVSGHCTGGSVSYVDVVPPGTRSISTTAGTGLTSSAQFTKSDVGVPVTGAGVPSGAYISGVTSASAATLSGTATAGAATIPADPTYTAYGLQLVVWFGA